MARGEYEQVKKRRRTKRNAGFMVLCLALLLTFAIGGTLAYIVANSAMVENQFVAGNVECQVNADGTVTNSANSNVGAYIRAAVIVNWMDNAGNVYGIKPSYTIVNNSGWRKVDDFFYYEQKVSPNGKTSSPPATVTVTDAAPNGYSLSIEIVAEAIQAEGIKDGTSTAAVMDAWGVQP